MNKWARLAGALVQGLVLALLLVVALYVMSSFDESARLFRYQGF